MKWTKELDEKVRKLINIGKSHEEIGIELNRTTSSINNRCRRLGLKILYFEEIPCKNCGKLFTKYISVKQKFCSSSCSGSFNNKRRKHSKETKIKIGIKSLGRFVSEETKQKFRGKNNPNWKGGKSIKIVLLTEEKIKIVNEEKLRRCRFCKLYKVDKKYKIICDDCKFQYYKFYRPLCEFDFKIEDYSDKFDLSFIKNNGKYSPSNKGNNLNGVSRDHMFSVYDGFINKIDPEIIKHPANCRLLLHSENNKKKTISSITLDELMERIKNW